MISTQALPSLADARDTAALGTGATSMKPIIRAAIYAALFIVAMKGIVALALEGQNVTPIWIASAILAWALISSPTRDWALVAGFAAIAHIAMAVLDGLSPATAAIYFTANVGGPLLCATLMRWQGITMDFEERGEVFRFLGLAGIIAPAASSAVIAIGTMVNPSRFELEDLGVWFLADALSYVVFIPIFHSIATGAWRSLLEDRVRVKAVILFGILIAMHIAGWYMPALIHNFWTIALVPYLVLMAFELGSAGASLAIAITAIGLLGNGLVVERPADAFLNTSVYLLASQFYIAAVATCLLPLAAALEEKNRLYEKASEALGDAQAAWGSLIAAEAHYRLIADNAGDMVMRIGLDGHIIFASPACRIIRDDVASLEGDDITDLIHPDDAQRASQDLRAFIAESVLDSPHSLSVRMKSAQGAWLAMDIRATLVGAKGPEPEEMIVVLREVNA